MKASKRYIELIEQFPLRPIHNHKQLSLATEMSNTLAIKGKSRSCDESDYMNVLNTLIHEYEQNSPSVQAFLKSATSISPQDMLQSFMHDHSLTQIELAQELGCSQSAISQFLTGARGLSKELALKLARRFAVSVDLFLK